jgi:hypothetical protein
MIRAALALCLLTTAVPGCFFFGGGTDSCASATDCSECANRASCGWCGATAECRTGSRSGPDVGSCGAGWVWLPSACSSTAAPCTAATDCASCTAGATCGWCASDGRCYDGTSTAPNAGTCGAGWAWLSSECTAGPLDAGRDVTSGCTPNCAGRTCGDDGCGGVCGTCTSGATCNATGQCQTITSGPACAHVSCNSVITCRWFVSGVTNNYDPCCADNGSSEWAMCGYPITAGGVTTCERSIGSTADQECHASPSTMHCDLPSGSIDCPALWIETQSDGTDWYFTGCCGEDTWSDPSGNTAGGLHCGMSNGATGGCIPASLTPHARPAP